MACSCHRHVSLVACTISKGNIFVEFVLQVFDFVWTKNWRFQPKVKCDTKSHGKSDGS